MYNTEMFANYPCQLKQLIHFTRRRRLRDATSSELLAVTDLLGRGQQTSYLH